MPAKLIAFSGLPATGKTYLAETLSKQLQIPMLSKDHFENILYREQLSDGSSLSSYHLLLETAKLELSLGISVIVDAVFPLQGFRTRLHEIAMETQAQLYVICTFCSDIELHKRRLLERPNHVLWKPVDWERLQEIASFYEAWSEDKALFLDAVDSFESNFGRVLGYIGE
jgi:predicted kinase